MGSAGIAVCKRGHDIQAACSCLASACGAFEDILRSTQVSSLRTKKGTTGKVLSPLSHSLIPTVSKSNVNACNKHLCTKNEQM